MSWASLALGMTVGGALVLLWTYDSKLHLALWKQYLLLLRVIIIITQISSNPNSTWVFEKSSKANQAFRDQEQRSGRLYLSPSCLSPILNHFDSVFNFLYIVTIWQYYCVPIIQIQYRYWKYVNVVFFCQLYLEPLIGRGWDRYFCSLLSFPSHSPAPFLQTVRTRPCLPVFSYSENIPIEITNLFVISFMM